MSTAAQPPRPARRTSPPRTRIGLWFGRPLASFHLIVTIAVLLTVLGLVMVLSASSAESFAADESGYALFTQQLIGVALGVVAFYVALRLPVRYLRKLSFPLFLVSLTMLMLVLIPGIGAARQGARRWFDFGVVSFQPSELAKVALVLWGAHLLASRRSEHGNIKSLLVPLLPAGLLMCLLVVLQPNLSTAIALGIILVALLWFAGLNARLFGAVLMTGLALATVLAFTAGYRSNRVKAWLNPGEDTSGLSYQSTQAKYSLADGGLFGRGLGQSRAKWSYLPNAHNDFIFAIIGEELGTIGCLAVIGLFGLFVYTGLRIAMRSVDPFLRLLTAGATCWVFGQAMINISYVVGLLPVTGLQLPLVSYGGTSTAITLLMFGIIASAARHEPEAIAALHAGQEGRIARALKLPLPAVFSPQRAAMARSKSTRPTLAAQDRKRLEARRGNNGRQARTPEPGRIRASSSRTDTMSPKSTERRGESVRGRARRPEPQRRDPAGYPAGSRSFPRPRPEPQNSYRPRPEPEPGRPPVRSGERGYRR